jgi:hypothetical protein
MLSVNRRFVGPSVKTVTIEKLKRYSTFRRKKSIGLSSAQWLPPPLQCLINRYVTFRRLNLPASVRRSPLLHLPMENVPPVWYLTQAEFNGQSLTDEKSISPPHTRQPSVHWKCTLDKNLNEKHVANHTVKNGYKSAFSSDKIIRLDASGLIDEAELKFLSPYISSKREKTFLQLVQWKIDIPYSNKS